MEGQRSCPDWDFFLSRTSEHSALNGALRRTTAVKRKEASGLVELQSDLWLDQPDAHERIEERVAGGSLSPVGGLAAKPSSAGGGRGAKVPWLSF